MKKLKKDMLQDFLEKLSNEYTVIAPVINERGYGEFKCTRDFVGLSLKNNSINGIKEFFFPQNEKLFTYRDGEVIENVSEKKVVIFGVRPCDIHSIQVLDKVFLDERFIDSYYKKRRDNTIIIGYSCPGSEPGCFCTRLGIDPKNSISSEMFMYEDEKNYYFEMNDEKAAAILEKLEAAEEGEVSCKTEVHIEAPQVPYDEKELFKADVWEKLYQKCLGCGTCTYLCPTCHCFEFYNKKSESGTDRMRCWDSCQYSLFTEHASGHNPRSTQKERIRQRLMHKFSYYPKNYGVIACVGCGRCLRKCPVAFDLREALNTLNLYIKEIREVTNG